MVLAGGRREVVELCDLVSRKLDGVGGHVLFDSGNPLGTGNGSDADGRVLLIRTTKAGWELPGGRVESGEDLLEAARREALEESGCSVKVGRLTGLYFGVDVATLLLVFRATSSTVDPHPDPNDEDAVDAGWFPAATALQDGDSCRRTSALGRCSGRSTGSCVPRIRTVHEYRQ
jgi:8-oxo-dGTP pyrophosphatase MutT (NUDIX family)